MDNYPQKLIDQYLKASSKLKKFDRVVFKRFAPNVTEVLEDFASLALKFEDAGIYQYAAMCHLGVAKCEMSVGNAVNECNAYLKAARAFLRAQICSDSSHLRSNMGEYREGALRSYAQALERCPDDGVMKAAIIREMSPLQPVYEGCSSFASPAHRIYELEFSAHSSIEKRDFLSALQHLDDIVDNVWERRKQDLYVDLLRRMEITRLFLLIVLNLPPARQSPSHVKLIEFYQRVGNFETEWPEGGPMVTYVSEEMKYGLAEIVIAWCERRTSDLRMLLEELSERFKSLNEVQRFIIRCICEKLDENY